MFGNWEGETLIQDRVAQQQALLRLDQAYALVETEGDIALAGEGMLAQQGAEGGRPCVGFLPALPPQRLGSPAFCAAFGVRYPYVAGAMANGIASVELVQAISRAGMLGFFGAAGLNVQVIEEALRTLQKTLTTPFGMNLIHSPSEPKLEADTVALYLRHQVRHIEASAYMGLTLPLVRYRVAGITRDDQGQIHTPNHVMGKVSRVEVAQRFFSPPPEAMLQELVREGHLSEEQASWARQVPMADALTAEADSGGHTDNRPALTLLPTMLALRDQFRTMGPQSRHIHVGAAGGIGTPQAAAAMFAMGADYIVTGSVNQGCLEAGTSPAVRQLLAEAAQADITMAPAADMFEMGVKVQVLKRGTMFAMRAGKLYTLYRDAESLETLPAKERAFLERQMFRAPLEQIWEQTKTYFAERDPTQLERAQADAKYKMALVFRWYLGLSSRWANQGEPQRKLDYQIWCGPAMGAFNTWVQGSPLEALSQRRVEDVALNLLVGAAYQTRLQQLRQQGATQLGQLPPFRPLSRESLRRCLGETNATPSQDETRTEAA